MRKADGRDSGIDHICKLMNLIVYIFDMQFLILHLECTFYQIPKVKTISAKVHLLTCKKHEHCSTNPSADRENLSFHIIGTN
jgi:hypothetical protein